MLIWYPIKLLHIYYVKLVVLYYRSKILLLALYLESGTKYPVVVADSRHIRQICEPIWTLKVDKAGHTMPGDLSTSMLVIRDNSTFPQYYSHVWWRIGVSRKLSPGNFCTIAKISGEFAKALRATFLGLKTTYIFIIHTKE